MKSFDIFMQHVHIDPLGTIDASGIVSKSCYLTWLHFRDTLPKYPEEAFRKTLTSHCRGDEGMRPFDPEVEEKVLEVLRKKQVWPCFRGTGKRIGSRGYQVKGYWEIAENKVPKQKKRRAESYQEHSKRIKKEEFDYETVSLPVERELRRLEVSLFHELQKTQEPSFDFDYNLNCIDLSLDEMLEEPFSITC